MGFEYKDEVDKKVLAKVLAEYFENQPVKYDHKIESQRVNEGTIILGPWAGPQADISNLFHEMAHLVEIDRPRMTRAGWGFKWGKYWQIGPHSGWEFQTAQSVAREVRVWAIHSNLEEHFLGSVDVADLTSSAEYLEALCFYTKGNKDERLAKVAADVQALRPQYPISWFKSEWMDRMKWLKEREKRLAKKKVLTVSI